MVVAPFSFLGLAAPERRRRAGLLGVSKAKGVTSEGESAVLEGFRGVATARALAAAGSTAAGLALVFVVVLLTGLLVSSVARLLAGIRELLSILQGQPYSLTI